MYETILLDGRLEIESKLTLQHTDASYAESGAFLTRKPFLLVLRAAMRRSRCVFIVGGLDGVPFDIADALSKALRLPLSESVNFAAAPAGAAGSSMLPQGAVPFWKKDGRLCGFLMDSGKQVIFVLSASGEDQKWAIKTYIRPYMERVTTQESRRNGAYPRA